MHPYKLMIFNYLFTTLLRFYFMYFVTERLYDNYKGLNMYFHMEMFAIILLTPSNLLTLILTLTHPNPNPNLDLE